MFIREKWLEEDCVFVRSRNCDACPYLVLDKNGFGKCEKEMHDNCGSDERIGEI